MKHKLLTVAFVAAALSASATSGFTTEVNPAADPEAYKLLEKASETRQVLPNDFFGLDAKLVYQEGEKTVTGTIRYRNNQKSIVEVAGLSENDFKWLERQAISFISHRNNGNFNDSEGKFPMSFGQSPVTDFGQLVEYNDPKKRTSRVRNNQSLELLRTAGDKRFLISVLENTEFDPGKFIPTRYVVSYFDPQTQVLQMVNIFENSYRKVENFWLPATRKVVTIDHVIGDGLRVRSFQFQDIQIVPKNP